MAIGAATTPAALVFLTLLFAVVLLLYLPANGLAEQL